MDSAPSLALLLEQQPQLREHTVAPPALLPFDGMAAAARTLGDCLRARNDRAAVQAALGNVLVREGRYLDALEAYRAAAEIDGAFAQAHLAASELAYILRDSETSRFHRGAALALQRLYPDPLPVGERFAVLALLRDEPYAVNTPIELILDRSRVAVHKYFVGGPAPAALPPFDVAFCAFGYADDGCAQAAAAFLERTGAPFVNDPRRFEGFAREALPGRLAGIEHLEVVRSRRVARSELHWDDGVILVRPAGTHAGDGLALVDSQEGLEAHVARFPASAYHVAPFIDYRSADGYFRKYRVVFVAGRAYPYHLAVSPRWMVHYQSAPMREHEWMRREELAFLSDPAGAIPRWDAVMGAIARAVDVDYFAVDLATLADGSVLVFEADSGMLVHDEDPSDVFAGKRPFVAAIREALLACAHEKDARAGGRKSSV